MKQTENLPAAPDIKPDSSQGLPVGLRAAGELKEPLQMNTEEKLDQLIQAAIEPVRDLHAFLVPLSLFDGQKYAAISMEASGYELPSVEVKAFLGDGLHIRSDSAKSILKQLADYSPIASKQKKIEALRSELSALESEASK